MQNLMRQSLQDYDTNFLKNKVHKTVFGYYSKQLDDIKVKEIDSSAVTALTEAFYHGRILADLNNNVHKLFTWFV